MKYNIVKCTYFYTKGYLNLTKKPELESNHSICCMYSQIVLVQIKYMWPFLVRSTDHVWVSGAIDNEHRVYTLNHRGNKSNKYTVERLLFLHVKVFYGRGFEL